MKPLLTGNPTALDMLVALLRVPEAQGVIIADVSNALGKDMRFKLEVRLLECEDKGTKTHFNVAAGYYEGLYASGAQRVGKA